MQKTRITGLALSSVPTYLINNKLGFKYIAENNEIIVDFKKNSIESYLTTCGFTKQMISIEVARRQKKSKVFFRHTF